MYIIFSMFSRRDLVKDKVNVKLKPDFTDLSSVSGLNSPKFIRKRNACDARDLFRMVCEMSNVTSLSQTLSFF